MARRPQDVTEAELEVLRALWELGPTTIRTLADRLYPQGGNSEYATVQKLLERLGDKGHVSHSAEGRQNVYEARVA
jgi:BlaI family penicillinase repressor